LLLRLPAKLLSIQRRKKIGEEREKPYELRTAARTRLVEHDIGEGDWGGNRVGSKKSWFTFWGPGVVSFQRWGKVSVLGARYRTKTTKLALGHEGRYLMNMVATGGAGSGMRSCGLLSNYACGGVKKLSSGEKRKSKNAWDALIRFVRSKNITTVLLEKKVFFTDSP